MNEIRKYSNEEKLLPLSTLVFGALFVWLLYGKQPGVSVPLLVITFYGLMLAFTKPMWKKEALFGWFLCIPVFLLSLTYLLFGNPVFRVLNLLALPVLILLQTLLITSANSFSWHSPGIIADMLYGIFYRCLVHVAKPFKILTNQFHSRQNGNGSRSVMVRVLVGLLISLPFLLILLVLLSSADMVFGNLVDQLSQLLVLINIADLTGRVIVALIIFFLSFSYLWSLTHGDRISEGTLKSLQPAIDIKKGYWDPVVIITVTAVVNLLYIIFVAIQFAYLFGGSGLPDGFTYSEYARRGFFELIFVTLLNIGFLAATLTFTKKAGAAAGVAIRLLNTVMIGCTFIMLYSAHFRMSLYEEAYGYTFLRILTQAFMVFLLVLFVITLVRVWKDGVPLLKPYIAAAIVAFVVVNYINADMIIARENIERYTKTQNIDISYFGDLSSDAVLKIKSLTSDKNADIAKQAMELLKERKAWLAKQNHWQSFNLADWRARTELEK